MNFSLPARLVLIACLIVPSLSFGQKNRSKIKSYYELINKAELSIIDSQYDAASQYYEKAFQEKYPNDKDLLNAFLVSYAQRDAKEAKKYLNELSYKGWNSENIKAVMDYPNKAFFNSISKQCDSFYEAGKSKKVFEMVSILDSIFNEDQRIRQPEFTDSAEAIRVDGQNLARLGQYIDKYGFPSFEQKGWWVRPGISYYNAYLTVWFVIWHQRGSDSTPLDNKIQSAVLDGDFRPDFWEAAQIYRDDAVKRYHIRLSDNDSNLTAGEIEEINKNRASIYLESLKDFRKKYEAQKNGNAQKYPFSFLNIFMVDIIYLSQKGYKI